LLKDVLELRDSGWRDRRPKKIEGPLKLQQVAAKAALENGNWVNQKASYGGSDWDTVGKERLGKLSSLLYNKDVSPCTTPTAADHKQQSFFPQKAEKTTKGTGAGAAMLEFLKNREKSEAPQTPSKPFDQDHCEKEISATLAELRVSHDVPEAITRIAEIKIPVEHQESKIQDLLAQLAEEGSQGARKAGFDLLAGLILKGHWKPEPTSKGVRTFLEDTCSDLKYDVPTLPQILRQELHPCLQPVVEAGLLRKDLQNALLSV
jgi:hypothetical protein